jgi:hypothetical protein
VPGDGDGDRLTVAGQECASISLPIVIIVHVCGLALQIVRVSDPSSVLDSFLAAHKLTTWWYGYRLDESRNLWDGSGLKVDSGLAGHLVVSFF